MIVIIIVADELIQREVLTFVNIFKRLEFNEINQVNFLLNCQEILSKLTSN